MKLDCFRDIALVFLKEIENIFKMAVVNNLYIKDIAQ